MLLCNKRSPLPYTFHCFSSILQNRVVQSFKMRFPQHILTKRPDPQETVLIVTADGCSLYKRVEFGGSNSGPIFLNLVSLYHSTVPIGEPRMVLVYKSYQSKLQNGIHPLATTTSSILRVSGRFFSTMMRIQQQNV